MAEQIKGRDTKNFGRNRLFVKVVGNSKEEVLRFIYSLQKVYPPNYLTVSPVILNKDGVGFHCYINVLLGV